MVSWRIWDYEERCFYFEDFSTAVRKFASPRYLLMSPLGLMPSLWSGDLLGDENGRHYLATTRGSFLVMEQFSYIPN